ncbi:MAG: type I-D CRISPR-associated protein Cas7/Csc2 [Anaerolineae bacterium]
MQFLNTDWFPKDVPSKPSGYYAHLILLRVTDSYPLFQTDGELNTARVQAGRQASDIVTRITMFKRKQTTPERLTGRELLRRYGLLTEEECDYNVDFCKTCPDCITYGFAIGDAGSEKSKVITDTAFSLTPYDDSHEAFTLNAPYEHGTMSRKGEVTSRISEQDHIRPQVVFPGVITARDLTANLFAFVVSNVLRTRRYGAQTSRTGKMENQLVAIALTDGEVFSNLRFTQTLYDALREAINPPDPVDINAALITATALVPDLLAEDGVAVDQLLTGEELTRALNAWSVEMGDGANTRAMLEAAFADSRRYYEAYVAKK